MTIRWHRAYYLVLRWLVTWAMMVDGLVGVVTLGVWSPLLHLRVGDLLDRYYLKYGC